MKSRRVKHTMKQNKKGQLSELGNRVLTVIFGVILLVAVAIPLTVSIINLEHDVINASGNLTQERILQGSSATVAGFIPLFLALAALALAAALVG